MSSQCRGGCFFTILTLVSLSSTSAQTPSAVPKADADEPILEVRHRAERDGWRIAETANFRLLHQHARALAEAVLRKAERARAEQMRKWFDDIGENWNPKCRIYLYPDAQTYSEATGAPVNPGGGHTDIRAEDERVLSRCIHVHGRRTFLLKGVVPHEVTHAVLAGRLGRRRVPRWADEGMAILAETQTHIDVHFRYLPRWRANDSLFGLRTLIEMRDYPEPHELGVFYAQSVSLVDFLTHQKGAKNFADFVRDGERAGYAASLREHYGWSFAELDRRWRRYAFFRDKTEESITSGGG